MEEKDRDSALIEKVLQLGSATMHITLNLEGHEETLTLPLPDDLESGRAWRKKKLTITVHETHMPTGRELRISVCKHQEVALTPEETARREANSRRYPSW